MIRVNIYLIIIILLSGCEDKDTSMFTQIKPDQTGINFSNDLPYTEEFNTYTYRNFYNGGGVALGDINNDGLLDIYLTGNIVDSKLYLNQGNWKFKDITESAGVACKDVWSTGASFADINGDGLLDLYVCKAGKPGGENRHNELFINKGDLTFEEQSEAYGLDVVGLSIHSAFFDYDKDGDLDCYLLNNSIRSVGGFNLKEGLRNIHDPEGNKFFRNDNGKFIDVTQEVGMYSSSIGYGLGITLSDFNLDNWTDIFISNDFFERDYLYFNNGDGTFREEGEVGIQSMSMGSMGADACDIDNDLLPDLFVTEMLPHTLVRKKVKAQYDSWDKYTASVKKGYHYQFPRNVLQRNIGNGDFLEIGRMAGVAATEWSWASLIQDFDNDGMKDLFVSNGIYKDLLDKDYLNFNANDQIIKSKIDKKENFITALIDSIPSESVQNNMFRNVGNFTFEDVSDEWGLKEKTFSNGSAYGDLDNDGDLDLVINNVNMPAFIYKNNVDTSINRSIQFKLKGLEGNRNAIGAKVIVKHENGQSMVENYTSKGFESCVDGKIHIGLGCISKVDTAVILWTDGSQTILTNLPSNNLYTVNQLGDEIKHTMLSNERKLVRQDTSISFTHRDINLNLFSRERLLVEMNGFDGPGIAVGDVNGDGIEDVFCGGGKNQGSILFLTQKGREGFRKIEKPFESEIRSETVVAEFFDSDNDGDLDLYVGHGGRTFSIYSLELHDVLYLNDGKGNFVIKEDALELPYPIHTGDISIGDYNKDGLDDIIIGEKMNNDQYGLPGNCIILKNNGKNTFVRVFSDFLQDEGMITSVVLEDMNNDSWPDIVLAGKWMPIVIIYNDIGSFSNRSKKDIIANSSGLWNTLYTYDMDGDGDNDILCGNEGLNNFYLPGMKMFVNDFDGNGTAEQIICEKIGEKYFPIHDLDEMISQMPVLKKKYVYYSPLAKASMSELFGESTVEAAITYELKELQSILLINDDAKFVKRELPKEIQYSSTYAFFVSGQEDGQSDVFCGGNNYQVKPQFGKQDASEGWHFTAKMINSNLSFDNGKPLNIQGQIREIKKYDNRLIFGINNDRVKSYLLNAEQ